MKYAHIIIMVLAFAALTYGWLKTPQIVDTATYVPMAAACVGGSMWMSNKAASTTAPTITPPATPAPPAPTPANTENPKP